MSGAEKIDYAKLQKGSGFGEVQKTELQKLKSQQEIKEEGIDNLNKLRAYILSDVKTESLKELKKIDDAKTTEIMNYINASDVKVADWTLVKDVLKKWIGGRSLASIKPYLGVALSQTLMMICCGQEDTLKNILPKFHTSKAVDGDYGLNTFSALKEVVGPEFNGLLDVNALNVLFERAKWTTPEVVDMKPEFNLDLLCAGSWFNYDILDRIGINDNDELNDMLADPAQGEINIIKGNSPTERRENLILVLGMLKSMVHVPDDKDASLKFSMNDKDLDPETQLLLTGLDMDDDQLNQFMTVVNGEATESVSLRDAKFAKLAEIKNILKPYVNIPVVQQTIETSIIPDLTNTSTVETGITSTVETGITSTVETGITSTIETTPAVASTIEVTIDDQTFVLTEQDGKLVSNDIYPINELSNGVFELSYSDLAGNHKLLLTKVDGVWKKYEAPDQNSNVEVTPF